MNIVIKDKKHIPSAVGRLLQMAGDKRIFAFYGAMGAGKTTIIKAICQKLGAVDVVTSPTFTLVNEYRTSKGEALFHIDFYRINRKEEVFDFGIGEYLTGESYCFMEWPELVEEILPEETLKLRLTVLDDQSRVIDFP
jgi:tRNA threonylcarbamoyladenosine biosynthesis protein TsaE